MGVNVLLLLVVLLAFASVVSGGVDFEEDFESEVPTENQSQKRSRKNEILSLHSNTPIIKHKKIITPPTIIPTPHPMFNKEFSYPKYQATPQYRSLENKYRRPKGYSSIFTKPKQIKTLSVVFKVIR